MQNGEINPNLAMSLTRQFGITIMNSEGEKIVQMLKFMHRQGFENGVAIEREACAVVCDSVYHQNIGPEFGEVRYGIAACAQAIRARGKA